MSTFTGPGNAFTFACLISFSFASYADDLFTLYFPDGAEVSYVSELISISNEFASITAGMDEYTDTRMYVSISPPYEGRLQFWTPDSFVSIGHYENVKTPYGPDVGFFSGQFDYDPFTYRCQSNATIDIHEFAKNVDGEITQLAFDFSMNCPGTSNSVVGAVRINSTYPLPSTDLQLHSSSSGTAKEGETVNINVHIPEGFMPVVSDWEQKSGNIPTARSTSGMYQETLEFTAPNVPPGGQVITHEFIAENSNGLSVSALASILVLDQDDELSELSINGSTGNKALPGKIVSLREPAASFRDSDSSFGGGKTIIVEAKGQWHFLIDPPGLQPIQEGIYTNARGVKDGDASQYYFRFADKDNEFCSDSTTGQVVINDVDYNTANRLIRLDADFQQSCDATGETLNGYLHFLTPNHYEKVN